MKREVGIEEFYGLLEAGAQAYAMELRELKQTDEKFWKLLMGETVEFRGYGYFDCTDFGPPLTIWSMLLHMWKRFFHKSKMPKALEPFDEKLKPEKHAESFIAKCDAISKSVLVEDIRNSIDEADLKCFWERHFVKTILEKQIRKFNLDLEKEYTKKLSHLDDYRRGESLSFPVAWQRSEDDEGIVSKLSAFFKDDDTVRRFLKSIKGRKDADITNVVNHYWEVGAIDKRTKKTQLWRVLHQKNLYHALESNWNAQVYFKKKQA